MKDPPYVWLPKLDIDGSLAATCRDRRFRPADSWCEGFPDSSQRMVVRHGRRLLGMDELSRQVLKLFIAMATESLDLHTLFEAGGNDPASRERVLDVVTRLADAGYLESQGSDFYLLTDKGRR